MNIGENLKRIRLLKNLSLKEAGELLGMSSTAISKFENGILKLNSEKLIKFADVYGVKVIDLLTVYQPCKLQFTSFRKRSRLTGERLALLKNIITKEVSKYLEVMKINGTKSIEIKKISCHSINDVEKIALKVRNEILHISDIQPLYRLTDILENLGIIIVYIDDYNELFSDFDGLSEIVEGIPVIVLLKHKDGARQRFTLAHELGHLILDIRDSNEEQICNRFASAILMPEKAMYNEFGEKRNKISLLELRYFKMEYQVSYQAIIHRLQDLQILTHSSAKNLYIIINKYLKTNDCSLIPVESSAKFKQIVYKLEASQIISIGKACELLGITLDEYNKENYCN